MMKHSLLPMNQHLFAVVNWDENTITQRDQELFERALQICKR